MPGLKGIENIKKAMTQRQSEQRGGLLSGDGEKMPEKEAEEAAVPSKEMERRIAERLAAQREAAAQRKAAREATSGAGAGAEKKLSANRFLGAAMRRDVPAAPAAEPPARGEHPQPQATAPAAAAPAASANPLIRDYYESEHMPPPRHKEVLDAIKAALGTESEGRINLQKTVLDVINIKRASAVRIIKHLEEYGYLKYKPQYHCIWIQILKQG